MDSHSPIATVAQALRRAERILVITGAGLSADSGMPTYRGLGGLYNGRTEEGLPIEAALSGPMLRRDPALCWKYLAELGKACLAARPNAGHEAIAELQKHKPECWVLTQNIELPSPGRLAGRAADRDPWRTGAALLPVLRCRERRPGGASARPVAAALRRLRWALRRRWCCSRKCCRKRRSIPCTANCAKASMRCWWWEPPRASLYRRTGAAHAAGGRLHRGGESWRDRPQRAGRCENDRTSLRHHAAGGKSHLSIKTCIGLIEKAN